MTSGEFQQNTLPTIEELQANPDRLMDQSVLRAVLQDPAQFFKYDEQQQPTVDSQQNVAGIQDYARNRIVRPEMTTGIAIAAAKEVNDTVDRRLSTVTTENLTDIETTTSGTIRTLADLLEQSLPQAKQGLASLEASLNDQYAEPGAWQDFEPTITNFATYYSDAKRQAGIRFETAEASVAQRRLDLETMADEVRRSRLLAEDSVQDVQARGYETDDTFNAVAERGAMTLGAHEEACREDTDGALSSMEKKWKAVRVVNGHFDEMQGDIKVIGAVLQDAPHEIHVSNEAQEIFARIRQAMQYGPQYATRIDESIQTLSTMFQRIEDSLKDITGARADRLAQEIKGAKSAIDSALVS